MGGGVQFPHRAFKRRVWTGEWLGFDVETGPRSRVLVREVNAAGPAAEKGLRRGDLITAVNGLATPTVYDFRLAEAGVGKGEHARLRVERGEGQALDVDVESRAFSVASLVRERLGFVARDATAEDAPKLGVSPEGGIVVTEVVPKGPAERNGVRAADVVMALGRERIHNLDDLAAFLEMVHAGDGIDLHIQRVVQDRFGNVGTREGKATLVAE